MQLPALRRDPRLFQIAALSLFLGWGIFGLHWEFSVLDMLLYFGGSYAFTLLGVALQEGEWPRWSNSNLQSSLRSVSISALSMSILLHTAHWSVALLAAALTVGSKYLFRWQGKHLFNPSAFGIVATIVLTGRAWISPGQWGSGAVLAFGAILLGTLVVTRVQKLDASLAFLVTFAGGLFLRQVVVLGWPLDYFTHSLLTGNLLIFSFFMISDPRTSPAHRGARILWAGAVGAVAFYFAAFQYANATAIFTLVAMAPAVPLLDRLFRAQNFSWGETGLPAGNGFRMNPVVLRGAGTALLLGGFSLLASAFCGFYVSKADGTLKNKTSQVILVRDGDRTSVTMYNDFQGDSKDFAMVVPVPVVLKERDIKVVSPDLFRTMNDYSGARLVEYHDENPCERRRAYALEKMATRDFAAPPSATPSAGAGSPKVTIEAKYLVGEYDILILSATESGALKDWLTQNGYKIPQNAEEVLDPYIKSGLKFFVVKVNEKEKAKLNNNFLRPIQIAYNSNRFMLPIRLGMANADGDQDMLVYAFTKRGRVELTNYRTVEMPTGQDIPLFVNDNFSAFYTNLFQHQWREEGKNIGLVEYAWDVSPQNYLKCDPCVGNPPAEGDLLTAGVWWLGRARYEDYENSGITNTDPSVFFTRLHIRYNRKTFPQDLQFQVTPNRQNFQARYVMHHPATGDLSCEEGIAYRKSLKQRRHNELQNLKALTGRDLTDWDLVGMKALEESLPADVAYASVEADRRQEPDTKNPLPLIAGLSGVALLGFWLGRKGK